MRLERRQLGYRSRTGYYAPRDPHGSRYDGGFYSVSEAGAGQYQVRIGVFQYLDRVYSRGRPQSRLDSGVWR